MRATDVVDGLRDLATRVSSNPTAKGVIDYSAALDLGWTRSDDPTRTVRPTGAARADAVSQNLARTDVDCYQVTRDMVPLVQMAADSLDETDQFRVDFAPSPHGFVQFERPVGILDIRGRVLHVSWLRWSVQPGNMLWAVAFSDTAYPDAIQDEDVAEADNSIREVFTHLGRWRWTGVAVVHDGEHLRLLTDEDREHVRENRYEAYKGVHDEQLARILKALWLLMAQQVGEVKSVPLDRAGQKRAKRLQLPTRVTVVELRRPKGLSEPGKPSEASWGVRWLVKGHYAWRACSEQHPFAEPYEKGWRARVFIHGYAKNAERDDLPWKMGETVYQLKR